MSDLFSWDWHAAQRARDAEQWIEVGYASHPIRPWCREEVCVFCGHNATHKAEESNVYYTHPLSAYLCCDHFWGYCESVRNVREAEG